MQTVQLVQGSPEWNAHRAQHWNASDAPAAMGCSPYMTRTELLHRLHTGISPEVSPETQRRFDDGHRFEALARPLAEEIIGEELYPVTGVEGRYSASFDGLTMMEDVAFEHKMLNADLRKVFDDIDTVAPEHRERMGGTLLPLHYQVQMEHQAKVSGCERILFMASEWNGNDELVEARHCWYHPNPELRRKLVAAWAQIEADLSVYVPSVVTVTPVAKPVASLPVVFDMRVEGKLIACNLEQYKPAALAYIAAINTTLATDQDFADATADAKFCRESAAKLKLAIEQALGQMGDVNAAISTVREIAAAFDAKGLALEKQVKTETDARREAIVTGGAQALRAHVASLNQRIGKPLMPAIPADFAGAIKGKRNLDSMQNAVDTELARAKIAANELADRMEANIKSLKGEAHDWSFLFPDLAAVAGKPAEDFANLLAARIGAHKQAEEQRRQREEQAEAARKAREAEAAAKAAQVVEKAAAPAVAQVQAALSNAINTGTGIVRMSAESVEHIDPATVRDNGATIKLGDINARLAPIQITTAGLAELGFQPVGKDKAAVLFRESDFPRICQALIDALRIAAGESAAV